MAAVWLLLACTAGCTANVDGERADTNAPAVELIDTPPRLLLFTKTAGFRHGNIEGGVDTIQTLCDDQGIKVVHTEDAAEFTDASLARFDVVAFFSTTGDVLDAPQQAAFERFIRAGGGFVGIHAATDTEYGWPWYNGLVGGYFAGHPKVQPAEIAVLDRDHPSTAHLPATWKRTDEWYNFKDLVESVDVLLNLDESTYEGGAMGTSHPIAWCHDYDGGRAWYTGGGHTAASFHEREFLDHLAGAIRWAAQAKQETSGSP